MKKVPIYIGSLFFTISIMLYGTNHNNQMAATWMSKKYVAIYGQETTFNPALMFDILLLAGAKFKLPNVIFSALQLIKSIDASLKDAFATELGAPDNHQTCINIALILATMHGQKNTVEKLVHKYHAAVNFEFSKPGLYENPLFVAVRNNNIELIQTLIDLEATLHRIHAYNGLTWEPIGCTPLSFACSPQAIELLLLSNTIHKTAYDTLALHLHKSIHSELLRTWNGKPPFHHIVTNTLSTDEKITKKNIRMCLKSGLPLHTCDSIGNTVLHLLISHPNLCLKILHHVAHTDSLKSQLETINIVNKERESPFHLLAQRAQDIKILKAFYDMNGDIHKKNKVNRTPLMYSLENKQLAGSISDFLSQIDLTRTSLFDIIAGCPHASSYTLSSYLIAYEKQGGNIRQVDTCGLTVESLLNTATKKMWKRMKNNNHKQPLIKKKSKRHKNRIKPAISSSTLITTPSNIFLSQVVPETVQETKKIEQYSEEVQSTAQHIQSPTLKDLTFGMPAIHYASRIIKWFLQEEIRNSANERSCAYHSFPLPIDRWIIRYGLKTNQSNRSTGLQDTRYWLPGLVKEDGSFSRIIFCICFANNDICYHRGFNQTQEQYKTDMSYHFQSELAILDAFIDQPKKSNRSQGLFRFYSNNIPISKFTTLKEYRNASIISLQDLLNKRTFFLLEKTNH